MADEGKYSNQSVTKLLRSVAAALKIKKANIFEIRAYETASDSIEHLTAEIKDVWEEGRMDDIPGLGKGLRSYLDEYFKSGKVGHFEALMKGIPSVVFDLLDITGVGPKTAQEIAGLGVKDFKDLEAKLSDGSLYKKGFSEKIGQKILLGLSEVSKNTGRMLMPYANAQADKILDYLRSSKDVIAADNLGSLRRKVVIVGDLDFAVASNNPEKVIEYFVKMPGISRVLNRGINPDKEGKKGAKANVIFHSGLEVDLLVGHPESYGALLQHFTGSKHHNIKLRIYSEKKGLSLSEYGVKNIKTGKVIPCKSEKELYDLLGMQTPEPEMREDRGEIEAALAHKLPKLIKFEDIKGDFHLHSNFPFPNPSHGPGVDPISDILKKAKELGYEYCGISDHPPGFRILSEEKIIQAVAKRTKEIEVINSSQKSVRVLNGLEIDILPDGKLSVPDEALKTLDYCIAGIHSSHRQQPKDKMTERILIGLSSPYVDILSHPTGRILNERDSFDADWEKIFEYCAKNKKLLEINAHPNRLDLRDDLVKLALSFGCKFIIDTDAHEISQMENMGYGIYLAKRGWVEAKDVVNSWEWKKLAEWFNIKA